MKKYAYYDDVCVIYNTLKSNREWLIYNSKENNFKVKYNNEIYDLPFENILKYELDSLFKERMNNHISLDEREKIIFRTNDEILKNRKYRLEVVYDDDFEEINFDEFKEYFNKYVIPYSTFDGIFDFQVIAE